MYCIYVVVCLKWPKGTLVEGGRERKIRRHRPTQVVPVFVEFIRHSETHAKNEAKSTKAGTMADHQQQQQHHLSVAIIGDAFADLLCFLGDSTLPKPGGDARLTQPIRTVAGGSGLNTATHCSSLGRSRTAGTGSRSGTMEVSLHTVLNESDDYGRLLTSHAKRHGFDLVNCRRAFDDSDDNSSSTGHCTVIVSRGERSFMTHLGCVSAFKADHVDVDGVLGLLGTRGNESNIASYSKHHLHVHIAGYYNIDGFFDGQLKRLLQTIRDRRGSGITTSLVPQHDATEKWDGGLLDLLPLVDYLICSEQEAECIANIAASTNTSTATGTSGTPGSNDILQQMASFFHRASPKTCVVVTLGPKGAVALRGDEIVHRQEAPVNISDPVDPTGAGDAFAAGFLHGIHRLRGESEIGDDDSSILRSGLFHGCLLGTSCVTREGASTPATSDELEALIQKSSSAGK